MGRNNGCYIAAVAGAFAAGVMLTLCCSLKTALFIAVCFLIYICWCVLRW